MKGTDVDFSSGEYHYVIDKTSETWESWEEWCRKVVWWCNKKGAYLYDCVPKDINANNTVKREGVENEPFGNDARYQ